MLFVPTMRPWIRMYTGSDARRQGEGGTTPRRRFGEGLAAVPLATDRTMNSPSPVPLVVPDMPLCGEAAEQSLQLVRQIPCPVSLPSQRSGSSAVSSIVTRRAGSVLVFHALSIKFQTRLSTRRVTEDRRRLRHRISN